MTYPQVGESYSLRVSDDVSIPVTVTQVMCVIPGSVYVRLGTDGPTVVVSHKVLR